MQLKLQPFFFSFEVLFRAQPHIPVLLPDTHVLSGKTYSTIPHLNILRLRDPNIQLIALLKYYILDTEWSG